MIYVAFVSLIWLIKLIIPGLTGHIIHLVKCSRVVIIQYGLTFFHLI